MPMERASNGEYFFRFPERGTSEHLERVESAILYAGAMQYPWYVAFEKEGDVYVVEMETGQETSAGTPLVARRRFTGRHLNAHLEAMITAEIPCITGVDWNDPEWDSEVDAWIADNVLQHFILGEVVFA